MTTASNVVIVMPPTLGDPNDPDPAATACESMVTGAGAHASVMSVRRAYSSIVTRNNRPDAVIFPGGRRPVGGLRGHLNVEERREMELARACFNQKIPTLGLCRGQQLLNVAFPDGTGTLTTLLNPDGPIETPHGFSDQLADIVHYVHPASNTLFGRLTDNRAVVGVNSWHYECIDRPAEGLVVSGLSHDGVIEAIETEDGLVLGLQFHPEELTTHPDWGAIWTPMLGKFLDQAERTLATLRPLALKPPVVDSFGLTLAEPGFVPPAATL